MNKSEWKEQGVRVMRNADLNEQMAQAAPGIRRAGAVTYERYGAEKLWVGRAVIEAGAMTGPHHHGGLESVIIIVSGRARMRWGDELEFSAEAGPGDIIYVPPFVPHQEINASEDEPLISILVRSDKDPVMVSLASGNQNDSAKNKAA